MSRITIPAAQVEFEDGGNTIWVTAPDGSTLLRIKTCGSIRKTTCAGSPSAHCDIVCGGKIDFCVPKTPKKCNKS